MKTIEAAHTRFLRSLKVVALRYRTPNVKIIDLPEAENVVEVK
jgi:hypothetical protein